MRSHVVPPASVAKEDEGDVFAPGRLHRSGTRHPRTGDLQFARRSAIPGQDFAAVIDDAGRAQRQRQSLGEQRIAS